MTTIHSIVAATDFFTRLRCSRRARCTNRLGPSCAAALVACLRCERLAQPQRCVRRQTADQGPASRRADAAAPCRSGKSLADRTRLHVDARFNVCDRDSAIKTWVAAHPTSLVVIASRADPTVPGVGSTASKVVRSPACPVLIVRSNPSRPYDKVLSAVDMREVSMRAAFTAVTLFPASHHHLIMAIDAALDHALRLGDVTKEQARVLQASIHSETVQQIERLARQLSESTQHPVASEVVSAPSAPAIIDHAQTLAADCVVVGHHGQGALEALLLGSTAQHVLHHTARDVLVVP